MVVILVILYLTATIRLHRQNIAVIHHRQLSNVEHTVLKYLETQITDREIFKIFSQGFVDKKCK